MNLHQEVLVKPGQSHFLQNATSWRPGYYEKIARNHLKGVMNFWMSLSIFFNSGGNNVSYRRWILAAKNILSTDLHRV